MKFLSLWSLLLLLQLQLLLLLLFHPLLQHIFRGYCIAGGMTIVGNYGEAGVGLHLDGGTLLFRTWT